MEEKISNSIETTLTVLSSVGITPYFNQVTGLTSLHFDGKQVGHIAHFADMAQGITTDKVCVGDDTYEIDTLEAIQRMKEAVMKKFGIEDPSALKITVQYLDDTVKRLEVIDKGDWIDLYAAETVEMKTGDFKMIHLGVAMKLPEGYEAHIVPRSSTFKKWGIIQANHMGVIDNSYSGPNDWWRMTAIAMRDTKIEKGDKICQFRIIDRQPKVRFVEGKMEGEDRGGFGSTGSK